MDNVDGVICTKDRPKLIIKATKRLRENINPLNLFVYDGSDKQDKKLHRFLSDNYDAKIISVRGYTFGAVRNLAICNSKNSFVAMIDDDIIYGKSWIKKVMVRFNDSEVLAVNGRLILGDKGTVIRKISESAIRDVGGSGGACVYDREKVLEVGNFDKNIHRGEDMEFKLRVEAYGYRWVKSRAVAFHPLENVLVFFGRAKLDSIAYNYILENSSHRTRFLVERLGSCLVMPFYYGFYTKDFRAFACWFIYRFNGLFSFLAKKYEVWKT